MDRYAAIIVFLYGLILVLLTVPVIYVFMVYDPTPKSGVKTGSIAEILMLYKEWGYWLWIVVMMACQAVLLFLPVKLGFSRPKSRKPVMVPIVVAALFLGIMLFAVLLAILSAIYLGEIKDWHAGAALVVALVFWVIWGIVFWKASQDADGNSLASKINKLLIRGSILELLIVVPTHIYIRSKDQCSAHFFSFFGITCGLTVMLLAFGPAVYLLYRERIKEKRGDGAG